MRSGSANTDGVGDIFRYNLTLQKACFWHLCYCRMHLEFMNIALIISFLFISSAVMANGITELPAEIQKFILSHASLSDIGSYCSISKGANKVCQCDLLWQTLSLRDLGGLKKPDNMTWKEFYIESRFLGKFVLIPGGSYEIGSPLTEAGRLNNENLHSVDLSRMPQSPRRPMRKLWEIILLDLKKPNIVRVALKRLK